MSFSSLPCNGFSFTCMKHILYHILYPDWSESDEYISVTVQTVYTNVKSVITSVVTKTSCRLILNQIPDLYICDAYAFQSCVRNDRVITGTNFHRCCMSWNLAIWNLPHNFCGINEIKPWDRLLWQNNGKSNSASLLLSVNCKGSAWRKRIRCQEINSTLENRIYQLCYLLTHISYVTENCGKLASFWKPLFFSLFLFLSSDVQAIQHSDYLSGADSGVFMQGKCLPKQRCETLW